MHQDLSNNYLKLKSKIRGNYLREQTSKLVLHPLNKEKQIENLKPIDPPCARRNSKSSINIDLVSCLDRGWLSTNRRGKPGKSVIPDFQAKTVNKFSLIPPITKKRNLELMETYEDVNKPGKKLMITNKSAENKQYVCSSCDKEFDSYFAFGGHRAFHVRQERKWCRYSPSWAELLYSRSPPAAEEVVHGYRNHDCPWCKKGFSNRQGLAAHSRFCYKKKQHMPTGCYDKSVIVARDFDLNELPPEAFRPEENPSLNSMH